MRTKENIAPCYNGKMKFSFSFSIVVVILSCIILGLLIFLNTSFTGFGHYMFSPLPSFLTLSDNSQVTTLDLWQPADILAATTNSLPILTAKSALSYDMTSDTILLEKNASSQVPMASLTKIMTAIVALEHPLQSNKYVVEGKDLVGEDSMGLDRGEVLSLDELLYGLILHSGNDAAEVLADNFPGGRENFVTAMNLKAASLGLTHTHFTNPTGLEGDGHQYTTARDLVVITAYALHQFPLFAKVAATVDVTLPQTATHKEYDLENETNLLTSYPGVKGIKTGYTPEAGLCLVTYLDYGGHKILAVILGSEDRRQEMKDILDFSLKELAIVPPKHE